LSAVVLKPLHGVCDALDDIGSGDADLTKRLAPGKSREFVRGADGFNRFIGRLERSSWRFDRAPNRWQAARRSLHKANLDLSQRTEVQASSLQQTASAMDGGMDELTASVASNAQNASQANQLALDAGQGAEKSGMTMVGVVTTMRDISESSKKITEITKVIDSIAFQTFGSVEKVEGGHRQVDIAGKTTSEIVAVRAFKAGSGTPPVAAAPEPVLVEPRRGNRANNVMPVTPVRSPISDPASRTARITSVEVVEVGAVSKTRTADGRERS